jgi:hypothetical protein
MATFEKTTAKTLLDKIIQCRGMVDFFMEKKQSTVLPEQELLEAEERRGYWFSRMHVYVDLAQELYGIDPAGDTSTDDRVAIRELKLITGVVE